jgi:hypothetical protein
MSRRDDAILAARGVINDTPQAALDLLSQQPGVFDALLTALEATRDVLCAPALWPECRAEIVLFLSVALRIRVESLERMKAELAASPDMRYEVALSAQRAVHIKAIRRYVAALKVFRDDAMIASLRAADAGDETIPLHERGKQAE